VGQELVKATCANAEEGLVGEAEFRAGDELKIDESFEGGVMGRAQVYNSDSAFAIRGGRAVFEDWVAVDEALDTFADRSISRSAPVRLDFKAVKLGGIVAGSNHNSTDGPVLLDGKGH
jgi:hypothetical protein